MVSCVLFFKTAQEFKFVYNTFMLKNDTKLKCIVVIMLLLFLGGVWHDIRKLGSKIVFVSYKTTAIISIVCAPDTQTVTL